MDEEFLFEGVSFCRVLKDYGAKLFAIQAAITRKNSQTQTRPRAPFYLRVKIDKFPRRLIGIEKLRGGNELAQAIAKGRLAVETRP